MFTGGFWDPHQHELMYEIEKMVIVSTLWRQIKSISTLVVETYMWEA